MHLTKRLYRIIECCSDFLFLVSGFRARMDWSVLRTQSRRQEAFIHERSSISSHRSSLDSLEKVVQILESTFARNSESFASVNCSKSAASFINFSVNALSEIPPALTRTL